MCGPLCRWITRDSGGSPETASIIPFPAGVRDLDRSSCIGKTSLGFTDISAEPLWARHISTTPLWAQRSHSVQESLSAVQEVATRTLTLLWIKITQLRMALRFKGGVEYAACAHARTCIARARVATASVVAYCCAVILSQGHTRDHGYQFEGIRLIRS